MLTFGGGPHHCLGAWLGRMTLEEVVRGVSVLAPTLVERPDDISWTAALGQNPAKLLITM